MIYLMLVIGIGIFAYGLVLLKREDKRRELVPQKEDEIIFTDSTLYEDEDAFEEEIFEEIEENIEDNGLERNQFNQLVKERMSEIKVEYKEERNEEIFEKLSKIEQMLIPIGEITEREKKLLSVEKELIRRERAIKRNENRIDKLVETKAKALTKAKTTGTNNTNAESDKNSTGSRVSKTLAKTSTSKTTTNRSTASRTNNTKENQKQEMIKKINDLEEQGKTLEEIAAQLSIGKGEVLLLRNLQKQLQK